MTRLSTLPVEWMVVPLGEVIRSAQSGFASGMRDPKGIIQIRMNNVTTSGNLDWTSFIRVPASVKQRNNYCLRAGDVLFNGTNSPDLVGKTAVFDGYPEPVVFSNHFVRLRVDETRLHPWYLARWLTEQWRRRVFQGLCTQWVNQASVRKGDVLSLKVPLPPLAEQKRIAAILAKAHRLRRLRCYPRELSDTYPQSVFLEMFGDPVTNPMGWPRARVSGLGTVQTGNTPPRSDPENYGTYIEWIKSDDIIPGRMYVSRSVEMLSESGLRAGRLVEAGSILVTCIAGSPSSIGNVALTDRRVSFNQQINALTPNSDVDPLFLYALFLVAKPLVQRSTTRAMKRMISKSKFEELVLMKPPLQLQRQLAHVVRRFERLRSQQRDAERQAEHLFQTLLHQAFRGELL